MPAAVAAFRKANQRAMRQPWSGTRRDVCGRIRSAQGRCRARKYFERAAAAAMPAAPRQSRLDALRRRSDIDPAEAQAMLAKAADGNSAGAVPARPDDGAGHGRPRRMTSAHARCSSATCTKPSRRPWTPDEAVAANGRGGPKDKETAKNSPRKTAAAAGGNECTKGRARALMPHGAHDQERRNSRASMSFNRADIAAFRPNIHERPLSL